MNCPKKIKSAVCSIVIVLLCCSTSGSGMSSCKIEKGKEHPKIVNIVNFIRLLEPRDPKITEEVLYNTVVKQVETMKKYNLGGTFLLQYDALLDPRWINRSMLTIRIRS